MFAQFERGTVIDRVIVGMGRKAATGNGKAAKVPTATASTPSPTLIVDEHEAVIVRLIFDHYTATG
jgi:site-specific DNA recombinase